MSWDAAEEEGAFDVRDAVVTVYLMPKSADEQESAPRKRRRSRELALQNVSLPLDTIHADSNRLRECSKYFEALMSRRWTTNPRTKFSLEMQTDVQHYRDCFDHLYFPKKPIARVADCIQLLKVASQIQFDEVMDIGVRHLAAVPWSDVEEKQIREFYDSGQLSTNSTSDLCRRLQVSLSREDRQQNYINLVQKILSGSLKLTSTGSSSMSRKENRRIFEEAFKAIVYGLGPGKCSKVLQIALTVVMEELESLLIFIQSECQAAAPRATLHKLLLPKVCWLFYLLRDANSAQAVVELLLKHPDLPPLLQTRFQSLPAEQLAQSRCAGMVRRMFGDVLDGRLYLKTSERLALSQQWHWLLKDDDFEQGAPPCATLIYSFIMTFPQEEQDKIYNHWQNSLHSETEQAASDLSEPFSMWVKHLVWKAVNLDAPKCSSTKWDSEIADGASSCRGMVRSKDVNVGYW